MFLSYPSGDTLLFSRRSATCETQGTIKKFPFLKNPFSLTSLDLPNILFQKFIITKEQTRPRTLPNLPFLLRKFLQKYNSLLFSTLFSLKAPTYASK
ncbi:hypothetical protein C6H88_00375 [Chlamydia muridarum str. Nigg]|uniref:Uncharacterized protein n=1 Tax=Chlamydia muridarum TaxID=83560 RepID=A0A097KGH1_CHLMR|nr:hypothetical protein BB17_00395 [Chlamydia muridarum str. Nigg 2 MCR]AIT91198.1 hypothetical protein NC81_00375 [Chlamydia muridarum]AVM87879.1 hypothetical protein C6H96_00375 [Chlamydia muridarum str. Nigg]AIW23072.1 hypothetical protein DNC_00375 [Chlamydia muridarum]AJR10988.1 hypothetical protein BD36_00400 [Chlamydia muridarum]